MFSENKDFYPTPRKLALKMISKIKKKYEKLRVLEPSAGAGDLLDVLKSERGNITYSAIESDPNLRAILTSKKYNIIDTDFLKYEGSEKFDLILANFPFSDGEYHLDRALDIMYNGQVICLVNAETIRNPYSIQRKKLIDRLETLGAEVTFLSEQFTCSETKRKTSVEVALIVVNIENSVEDLFSKGLKSSGEDTPAFRPEENYDLVSSDSVSQLVEFYKKEKDLVTTQIMMFYENYHSVKDYINLEVVGQDDKWKSSPSSLTDLVQEKINEVCSLMKINYWRRVVSLKEVRTKLTSKKEDELNHIIEVYKSMDFNTHNIESFILNVSAHFPDMIKESIVDLFDSITKYSVLDSRWGDEYKKNVHFFNAWKTNNGFKINKKIILPFYKRYSMSDLEIASSGEKFLDDLDRVLSYFSGVKINNFSTEVAKEAMRNGQNKNIETDNFILTFYQKGTVHITFKNEDNLRDFNIEASKLKNWLPMDYSEKKESEMTFEELSIVDEFEGLTNYSPRESGTNEYSLLLGQRDRQLKLA